MPAKVPLERAVSRLFENREELIMGTAEQYAPMTDEQRARWTETRLFPVERWKQGEDCTPLVCPTPTNEELRALALG